jgi:hypothetical protein
MNDTPCGALILAAPGSGKSTWVAQQHVWRDADVWAGEAGLHPLEWHASEHTLADEKAHYQAIDAALLQARAAGKQIVGALFWEVIPDAIVVIPLTEYRRRVSMRSDLKWTEAMRVRTILDTLARGFRRTIALAIRNQIGTRPVVLTHRLVRGMDRLHVVTAEMVEGVVIVA